MSIRFESPQTPQGQGQPVDDKHAGEGRVRYLRAWLLASRPKTLTAAVAPVLLGSAIAFSRAGFRWGPAVAALLVAVLIQIGTNFHNDVMDYERGTDLNDRLGPVRVTQAGLLSPRAVRRGVWFSFGLAGLAGLYLTWVAGWPVLVIGLASILAGMAYTAGPYPLAYIGWGDVFVLLFFGFAAVCGTVYVQMGSVPGVAWWWALGLGALTTALLDVNNIRDMQTDQRAGRRTVPVVFGRNAAMFELALLLALGYLVPAGLFLGGQETAWVLLTWLSVPLAVALFRSVWQERGRALNKALAASGRLILVYALLAATGLILDVC